MLSVLAEAVLFDWDNVADIAREAAKMVHEQTTRQWQTN